MQKIRLSLIFIFLTLLFSTQAQELTKSTKTLLHELDELLITKDVFQDKKLKRINFLREELLSCKNDANKALEYELTLRLYEEYQSFIYDSAFKYVIDLIHIAQEIKDPTIINQAKIELGFTYLSSGLFKESLDTMLSINSQSLKPYVRVKYYDVVSRAYFDLASYHSDNYYSPLYKNRGIKILDSAINILTDTNSQYWLLMGIRQAQAQNIQQSADAFNFFISEFQISPHDYAIATSALGWVYTMLDRKNDALDMNIRAAISDIKASTKETVAFSSIAIQLHEFEAINLAYKYILIALENANFYNARHRKMAISEVLPIIEGKRLDALESQRKRLLHYGYATTLLILMVTLFSLIIYKQLKKLKTIRKIMQETNKNLQRMNDSLRENNKIKEEYIAQFFNINADFIELLTAYRKTIQRKVASRQFDDLKEVIKAKDLKRERDKLFENFDHIFLKIFPEFVERFNELFDENDKIILEKGELLNTHLRIFALIRLGITDNEKIASFLNYSVNTIYTYKTKLKQKANISNEAFYAHIREIKAE